MECDSDTDGYIRADKSELKMISANEFSHNSKRRNEEEIHTSEEIHIKEGIY